MSDQTPKLRRLLVIASLLNGVLFMTMLGIAVDSDGWEIRTVLFSGIGVAINFALWLSATRQVRGIFRANDMDTQSSRET